MTYIHTYIDSKSHFVKLFGMDGWMDGWMVGWMDGWMDGWMSHEEMVTCESHDHKCSYGRWLHPIDAALIMMTTTMTTMTTRILMMMTMKMRMPMMMMTMKMMMFVVNVNQFNPFK